MDVPLEVFGKKGGGKRPTVSILIVVDVPLEAPGGGGGIIPQVVSILIVVDVPLEARQNTISS